MIVANPRKTRAIYQNERKSDRRDAMMLARLARMDPTFLGDDWNAIRIIALSQSNPLKAIAELVENSIDAHARKITITRGREHGEHYLAIRDDGDGVPRDANGIPDFRYVATHICDSVKRRLKSQGTGAGIQVCCKKRPFANQLAAPALQLHRGHCGFGPHLLVSRAQIFFAELRKLLLGRRFAVLLSFWQPRLRPCYPLGGWPAHSLKCECFVVVNRLVSGPPSGALWKRDWHRT